MLINCPKCGFSQPKDSYCAKCGVDMEHFRPPKAPLFRRMWNNPTAPVGLTLAMAIFSFWHIRQHFKLSSPPDSSQPRTFVRNFERDRVSELSDGSAASDRFAGTEPGAELSADPPQSAAATTLAAERTTATVSSIEPQSEARAFNDASTAQELTAPVTLRLSIIEVPKTLLASLLEAQEAAGPQGLGSEELESLWAYVDSNADSALHSEELNFEGKSLKREASLADSLRLSASIQGRKPATESSKVLGKIEMNGTIPLMEQGQSTIKNENFEGSFEVSPNRVWLQKLVLPRGEPAEPHHLSGVHRIYRSRSFQNQESEVTLILEVQ